SVDPDRDATTVAKYAKNFGDDFIGVTGKPAELDKVSGFFGVHSAKREAAGSKLGYTIDHNGDFFLLDPFGRWVKLYRPPFKQGMLANDLPRILRSRPNLEVVDAWVRKPAEGIAV